MMSTTFNFDSNLPEDDKFGGKVFEVLKVLKCDSNSSNIILNTKNYRTLCGNNCKKVLLSNETYLFQNKNLLFVLKISWLVSSCGFVFDFQILPANNIIWTSIFSLVLYFALKKIWYAVGQININHCQNIWIQIISIFHI